MTAPVSGPVDLRGRTAFVSGASRGIGRAICMALGREGAAVACGDVLEVSETVAALSAIGAEAMALACDVRAQEQVAAALKRVVEAWGRLDILVCNAGDPGRLAGSGGGDKRGGVGHGARSQSPRSIFFDPGRLAAHGGAERRQDRLHGLHRGTDRRHPRGTASTAPPREGSTRW